MIDDEAILTEYQRRPFELIEHRLSATRNYLVDAPEDVVGTALHLSSINSIMSLNTYVHAHERATASVWDAIQSGQTDREALGERAHQQTPDGSKHVMYYDSKARYVHNNLLAVDWVELARLLRDEGVHACQQQLVDDVMGLKNRKAGFTLANLGFTDACCMDSIMERAFDVQSGTSAGRWDTIYPFDTTVTERYYDRVDELRAETPQASATLDRYCWQWAAWSTHRNDGFAVHDPWFLVLDSILPVDVFDPVGATDSVGAEQSDERSRIDPTTN